MSFDTINVNLHYDGVMKHEHSNYIYNGGSMKSGIFIDHDYITRSMFNGFCEDYGIEGVVVRSWYKLPKQSMNSVVPIFELSSDGEINKMCSAAMGEGEVDVYLENKSKVSMSVDLSREQEKDKGEEVSNETAPPASSSRGRGRGHGRVRGRGRGRGRGRAVEPISRGYGCYISPFTGRLFEVCGSRATDLEGHPPQQPEDL